MKGKVMKTHQLVVITIIIVWCLFSKISYSQLYLKPMVSAGINSVLKVNEQAGTRLGNLNPKNTFYANIGSDFGYQMGRISVFSGLKFSYAKAKLDHVSSHNIDLIIPVGLDLKLFDHLHLTSELFYSNKLYDISKDFIIFNENEIAKQSFGVAGGIGFDFLDKYMVYLNANTEFGPIWEFQSTGTMYYNRNYYITFCYRIFNED